MLSVMSVSSDVIHDAGFFGAKKAMLREDHLAPISHYGEVQARYALKSRRAAALSEMLLFLDSALRGLWEQDRRATALGNRKLMR